MSIRSTSGVTFIILLYIVSPCVSLLQFFSVDGSVFPSDNITVGSGSDVLITVRCSNNSMGTYNWLFSNGSSVSDPLTAFGVSQDPSEGVLRIYPAPLIGEEDLQTFTCDINGRNNNITFTLLESLFFTDPLPTAVRDDTSLNCSLPDLPLSTVTFVETNPRNSSCSVTSDRGSFSRLVPILSEPAPAVPQIVVQPVNTTAADGGPAAFSCIVSPVQSDSYSLVNITWTFESEFSDASGSMGPMGPETPGGIITEGVRNGFPYPGTSILLLEVVDMSFDGQYRCVANYSDGFSVASEMAALQVMVDNVTLSFLLRPPANFTVSEGSTLTLPCVADGNGTASWSYSGSGLYNSSEFGSVTIDRFSISIESVGRTAAGILTCEVDGENASTLLIVEAPLRFESTPDNETTVYEGEMVTLECVASGNPPPDVIMWFVNNTAITEGVSDDGTNLTLTNVQPNDTGIYQCVAKTEQETIAAYTYLLVQFLGDAVVSPIVTLVNPAEPEDFILNCTVPSHPLVLIEWTNSGGVVLFSRQLAVGFRGPSVSELDLNSGDLSGRNLFNCSAELNNKITEETVIVNAFSPVTITVQPEDTPPVLIGFTVSFLCQAQSIPPPMIAWSRNMSGSEGFVVITDSGGDNVMIEMVSEGNTTTSNLTITSVRDGDFGDYRCFASNEFFNATSEPATLVRGAEANVTMQPVGVTLVWEEVAVFTCIAEGFPRPSITWNVSADSDRFVDTPFNISSTRSGSNLTGPALTNLTRVHCIASNIFVDTPSTVVLIIIAGPPLIPFVENVISGPRNATVNWDPPFSLLDILDYTVILSNEGGVAIASFTVEETTITINETHLDPFTNYSVGVAARNRAGLSNSEGREFQTLQAAPDAPPTNLRTVAAVLREIAVSWSPPPADQHNGIITSYIVSYMVVGQPPISTATVAGDVFNTTLSDLLSGTTYRVRVVAVTVAAGPSATVTQDTISSPPNIIEEVPSSPQSASTNSIPIVIPVFSTMDVASLWVVIIKINDTFNITDTPDNAYPNNNTFVFASLEQTIPLERPYVAAEISPDNPDFPGLPYTFLIGDQAATNSINDFPSLYSNPPLDSGTSYTAFIRVFPPPVSDSFLVSKRQAAAGGRQYTVFTSTRYLPPVRTASPAEGGLNGGEIAGIIISLLMVVVVVAVVAVIVFVLFKSTHYYSHNIPPPSRKGSMRLTESQKLLDSPFPSVKHGRGSEIVTIVRNPHNRASGPLSPLIPPDERVPIFKARLLDYVKTLHANSDHLFAEEYEVIGIKSPSLAHQASQLPCNQPKNRYANINSYDKTRVILKEIPGVEGFDYINANYISGFMKDNAYIAAQGPLPETTHDFWRMVWEQESCCIVMLTNTVEKGRTKCHQYWPSSGSISFNDLTVTMVDQQVLAYYTIRTFILNMGNDRREVKQYHFTSWPDFGVPDHPNPILGFIRRVNNSARNHRGPDIIHCSAGVGRTGTYITIQSMMQMMEEEDKIDVFNFVLGMRHERNLMVQTEAQYIFIHDALVELIRVGNTEVTIQRLPKELKLLMEVDSEKEICPLETQFDNLNALDIPNPDSYMSAILPINKEKNRFPDVLPYEPYRVRLLMQPGVLGSDYINASFVDGYLRRNQFILTQGPMATTVNDFWRMLWEHRVSAIVMLCSLEERGKEQSARYWPTDKMTQYGDMFVETVKETDTGFYCMREFQITHTKQNNDVRTLKHFHYTDWLEEKCPDSSSALLDMLALVQKAHHLYGGGPVVVHDCSSIGRAGTFCVMNIVIERLKVEGMVDIFFTIHSLRRKHPGIVSSYNQYLFCFTTVQEYLDSFDKYSNFD